MKIALIDPSNFTWPYNLKLAEGLEANGHDVAIYGRAPSSPLSATEERFLRCHFYPGLETKIFRRLPRPFFLGLKGLSHIESMARLLFHLRKRPPDAIHFQWAPLPVIDKRYIPAFRRIAPTILTVHDSAPFNNNPASGLQRLGSIKIMERFDHLIVHTTTALVRLKGYGIPADRISLIPHGLLMPAPLTRLPSVKEVSATSVSGRIVTLLLFGRIKPYKGADILIRALAELPLEIRSLCKVRIVGEPHMPMEPLFALADVLGVRANIAFELRYIAEDEIGELLGQADIQVFPYREIDASGVLMLAVGAGRPIVASRIGLFGEILEDGRHGALVEPGSPRALALALAPLIVDHERRAAAAKEVSTLRGSIPSWQEIASLSEVVYRRGDKPNIVLE